jgi:hypothetical protein
MLQELGDRAVEAQACYSLGNTYTLLKVPVLNFQIFYMFCNEYLPGTGSVAVPDPDFLDQKRSVFGQFFEKNFLLQKVGTKFV